jgi:hypothetical protein
MPRKANPRPKHRCICLTLGGILRKKITLMEVYSKTELLQPLHDTIFDYLIRNIEENSRQLANNFMDSKECFKNTINEI